MRGKKVTLGWVLSILALIVLFITTIASQLIVATKTAAIIAAVSIAVVLFVLIAFLIKVKKVSKPIYFKRNAIIELFACIIIVAVYVIVFFSVKPNNQFFYFCVNSDEVRESLKSDLKMIKDIDANYDEYVSNNLEEYGNTLKSLIPGEPLFVKEKLNIIDIEAALTKYQAENTNYNKDQYEKFADDVLANVDNLGPIKLIEQSAEVNGFTGAIVDSLKNLNVAENRNRPSFEPKEWNSSWDSADSMKYKQDQPLCWLTILVDILLLIIIFIPYLFAERDLRVGNIWGALNYDNNRKKTNGGGLIIDNDDE